MVDNISNTGRLIESYNNNPNSFYRGTSSHHHHHHEHQQHNQENNNDNEDEGCGATGIMMKEQLAADGLLPIANVGRIMKQIVPPNAKISKEAKETMQECVSEFISFVTGEASDKCHKEKRKTINGDDICWALTSLGFDDYSQPLKRFLQRYRHFETQRLLANHHNKADRETTTTMYP